MKPLPAHTHAAAAAAANVHSSFPRHAWPQSIRQAPFLDAVESGSEGTPHDVL